MGPLQYSSIGLERDEAKVVVMFFAERAIGRLRIHFLDGFLVRFPKFLGGRG